MSRAQLDRIVQEKLNVSLDEFKAIVKDTSAEMLVGNSLRCNRIVDHTSLVTNLIDAFKHGFKVKLNNDPIKEPKQITDSDGDFSSYLNLQIAGAVSGTILRVKRKEKWLRYRKLERGDWKLYEKSANQSPEFIEQNSILLPRGIRSVVAKKLGVTITAAAFDDAFNFIVNECNKDAARMRKQHSKGNK